MVPKLFSGRSKAHNLFLKEQEFAESLSNVVFKPIIRQPLRPAGKGFIPLTSVGADGNALNGTCMTSAGAGGSPCDNCHFVDEQTSFLREETKKRGFPTLDGIHMGPCEIHKRYAHTIGPDGSLYACPGFSSETTLSMGHIDGRRDASHRSVWLSRSRSRPRRSSTGTVRSCRCAGAGAPSRRTSSLAT